MADAAAQIRWARAYIQRTYGNQTDAEIAHRAADAEQIAQAFHEAYKKDFWGFAQPWAGVPENYRASLTKAMQSLLDGGIITGGSVTQVLSHG